MLAGDGPACSPRPQHPRRRGAARLPGPRGRARLAAGRRRARRPTTRCPHLQRRRRRRGSTRSSSGLYRDVAQTLSGLVAREHTAQVPPEERRKREDEFREAELQAAVLLADDGARRRHRRASTPSRMRNVPPTPGELRAALRPRRPVRPARPGHHVLRHRQQPRPVLLPPLRARWSPASVAPPRLDLPTRTWSARTSTRSGSPRPASSWAGRSPSPRHGRHRAGRQAAARPARCALTADVATRASPTRSAVAAPSRAPRPCSGADRRTWPTRTSWWDGLGRATWSAPAPRAFDRAFDRWRDLYRAALVDQWEQNRRRLDHSLSQRDRDIAGRAPQRGRDPAEPAEQRGQRRPEPHRRLLPLPLPRLRGLPARLPSPGCRSPPTSRPGRRPRADGDYVQRPGSWRSASSARGALIYHEGARYQVDQRPAAAGRGEASVVTHQAHRCAPAAATTTTSRSASTAASTCGSALARRRSPACCGCTPCSPAAASGSPPTRRNAAAPGFELVTSYRFQDHGDRPGPPRRDRRRAAGAPRRATWPTATPRRSGDQPRPAPPPEARPDGFWLGPVDRRLADRRQAAAARRRRRGPDDDGDAPTGSARGSSRTSRTAATSWSSSSPTRS